MTFTLGLFVGLFMGATLGVMAMAIVVAARDRDAELDEYDAYLRRLQHTCTAGCAPLYERHVDERGRRLA